MQEVFQPKWQNMLKHGPQGTFTGVKWFGNPNLNPTSPLKGKTHQQGYSQGY